MSEFASIVVVAGSASRVPVQSKFASPWKLPNEVTCSDPSLSSIPALARVLRSFIYGDDGRRSQEMITDDGTECNKNITNKREITVGIQWPPDEFVKLALNKQHPNTFVKSLPGVMINTLNRLVQASTCDIARERTASARKWFLRAQELRGEESKFKYSLSTHCSTILRNKRLLIFREMLLESGYGDVKLVENMSRGFDLMGDLPTSGVFAKKHTYATLTPEQVRESASMNRNAILTSVRRPMDSSICRGVYEATMAELEAGWLVGPIDVNSLNPRSVCTRRFGVEQKSTNPSGEAVVKIRPIDDYTESLVNLTNGSQESISVHGVDFIVSGIAHRMDLCRTSGISPDLLTKTVDLRKAYKQLPVSEASLEDSYLCVKDPVNGDPKLFQCRVLPFGARAAVAGFCRTSHAIWYIGTSILLLHWSVYFDDFVIVEDARSAKHCECIVNGLFSLLGWETSEEKGGTFESSAKALGVIFDLADSRLLKVRVCNSPNRCREIGDLIDKILKSDTTDKSELEVLRGRLIFMESQIFGRVAHAALRVISSAINGAPFTRVDQDLRRALTFLKSRVLNDPPKELTSVHRNVIHIYTDACFEPHLSGLGGVAYTASGQTIGFFGEALQSCQVNRIKKTGQKTIIGELEALAMLAGARTWLEGLASSLVVIFCDNDGALASMIKVGSHNPFVFAVACLLAECETASNHRFWFERVPSVSNPSDGPSRQHFEGLDPALRIRLVIDQLVDDVCIRRSDPLM